MFDSDLKGQTTASLRNRTENVRKPASDNEDHGFRRVFRHRRRETSRSGTNDVICKLSDEDSTLGCRIHGRAFASAA